jgi:phosphatidylserine/phosphatidylglycerophosphate/cardiolipin synthase-like enzyme
VVADAGGRLRALVTSANPHDGSSAHTNVGALFDGPAARAVLETERAVVAFSGGAAIPADLPETAAAPLSPAPSDALRIQVVTEEKIADAAEAMIDAAGAGDALDLVMFYLADRPIVRALKAAARRGVDLRVVLDPNKDAFGRKKNGMPNRQVARELVAAGVPVPGAHARRLMHAKCCWSARAAATRS